MFGVDAIPGFLMLVTALGLIGGLAHWRMTRLKSVWQAAAARLGLRYDGQGPFRTPRLEGVIGDCAVTVSVHSDEAAGTNRTATVVSVHAARIPVTFSASAKSAWTRMTERLLPSGAANLGDADFDRIVRIDGDSTYALAALSPAIRRSLRSFVSQDGCLRGQQLKLVAAGIVAREENLTQIVRAVAALGNGLSLPIDRWPDGLRDRAANDSVLAIRRSSLLTLVRRYPTSPATQQAIEERLEDSEPEIRLMAARHAGERGVPAARTVFDDLGASVSLRAAALQVWGHSAPADDSALKRGLTQALNSRTDELVGAALEVVRSKRPSGLTSEVRGALAADQPYVVAAALRALEATGGPDDVAFVLPYLSASEAEVAVAAVEAIGGIGHVEAVERLLPLTRGLTRSPQLKMTARAAIARIQARTGGQRGQLALVDEGAPAGRLSPIPESGGLSPPSEDE